MVESLALKTLGARDVKAMGFTARGPQQLLPATFDPEIN